MSGYWSSIKRGSRGLRATCCPDKAHYAKGKCRKCYWKEKRQEPDFKEKERVRLAASGKKRVRVKSPQTKEQAKNKRDKLLYNLKPGERQKIWNHQNGIDPITGQPLKPNANLDHDHKTGLIRGLLNPLTNKMLVDNVEKLQRMLAYLNNPPAIKALGETVYGLLGKAQTKRKMRYGPTGTKTPQERNRQAQEGE